MWPAHTHRGDGQGPNKHSWQPLIEGLGNCLSLSSPTGTRRDHSSRSRQSMTLPSLCMAKAKKPTSASTTIPGRQDVGEVCRGAAESANCSHVSLIGDHPPESPASLPYDAWPKTLLGCHQQCCWHVQPHVSIAASVDSASIGAMATTPFSVPDIEAHAAHGAALYHQLPHHGMHAPLACPKPMHAAFEG